MMDTNDGRDPSGQALVSDQASVPCPDPTGFDPSRTYRERIKFWAIVRDRDGNKMGVVEGRTRAEVEDKASALAGEPVDMVWSDRKPGDIL